MIMWFIRKIKSLWYWLTGRSPKLHYLQVEELPDKLSPQKIYLIGENEHLWFAAFICPCGCGETLQMSLIPNQHPKWTVTKHENGTASLHPSVWRQVGCKSHFWLRSGKIVWCPLES